MFRNREMTVWRVLTTISELGTANKTQIAKKSGLTLPTINDVLYVLALSGYIKYEKGNRDFNIQITDKGKDLAERLRKAKELIPEFF